MAAAGALAARKRSVLDANTVEWPLCSGLSGAGLGSYAPGPALLLAPPPAPASGGAPAGLKRGALAPNTPPLEMAALAAIWYARPPVASGRYSPGPGMPLSSRPKRELVELKGLGSDSAAWMREGPALPGGGSYAPGPGVRMYVGAASEVRGSISEPRRADDPKNCSSRGSGCAPSPLPSELYAPGPGVRSHSCTLLCALSGTRDANADVPLAPPNCTSTPLMDTTMPPPATGLVSLARLYAPGPGVSLLTCRPRLVRDAPHTTALGLAGCAAARSYAPGPTVSRPTPVSTGSCGRCITSRPCGPSS
mmetsp:Transcript_25559/g.64844  ORF Transcript_25559/g.64844 Transcript_25559/m.64844 type:complete len:307 (-) Transcript_25559:557-1477(-)